MFDCVAGSWQGFCGGAILHYFSRGNSPTLRNLIRSANRNWIRWSNAVAADHVNGVLSRAFAEADRTKELTYNRVKYDIHVTPPAINPNSGNTVRVITITKRPLK